LEKGNAKPVGWGSRSLVKRSKEGRIGRGGFKEDKQRVHLSKKGGSKNNVDGANVIVLRRLENVSSWG